MTEMAGLRVVLTLEGQNKRVSDTSNSSKNNTTIISKATTILVNNMMTMMMINDKPDHRSSSSTYGSNNQSSSVQLPTASAANYLDFCCLCRRELLPGRDVYMYKGDRGFCSTECRSNQMVMDEDEDRLRTMRRKKHNCSLTAMKNTRGQSTSTLASRTTTSMPSEPRHHHPDTCNNYCGGRRY